MIFPQHRCPRCGALFYLRWADGEKCNFLCDGVLRSLTEAEIAAFMIGGELALRAIHVEEST